MTLSLTLYELCVGANISFAWIYKVKVSIGPDFPPQGTCVPPVCAPVAPFILTKTLPFAQKILKT